MSGVFEKQPLIDPRHEWGADTCAKAYRYFYCPKCRARHKYRHLQNYVDCFRCFHTFSPDCDSYRYEDDRVTNLPQAEREQAYLDIYGMPLVEWEAKCAEREAYATKKQQQQAMKQRWYYRLYAQIVLRWLPKSTPGNTIKKVKKN